MNKIGYGLILATFVFISCDSLLDVDSERYVFPEDHIINSTTEALYGTNGLFLELSKLADRYVLLGELRGDLLDVTTNARPEIKALNNFTYTADNFLIDTRDYYSVINNCNYIINNIDTTIIQHAENILYREYAATKAIRAWTYMQLALNFGSAIYYEEPVLTITDAEKDFPEYNFDQLADVLIQDLLPWVDIKEPENISIGEDVNSEQLFFPVRFVLGELFLWKGDYENAARQYYELIYDNEYIIDQNSQSTWIVENNAFTQSRYINWWGMFDFNDPEHITMLAGSIEHGEGVLLDTLMYMNYELTPSVAAVQYFDDQIYYHNATITKGGDLRGHYGSYYDYSQVAGLNNTTSRSENYIFKFQNLVSETTKAVPVYRIGLLYLRYAEAVNRTGKPGLAFATLKNGLSAATMSVDTIVPPSEKYMSYDSEGNGLFFDYTNFEDILFDENIGVHERGCGQVHLALDYVIPPLGSKDDSINYVEDKIVEELALETAFEGNRFNDLMRIAIRRDDPSYLAKRVAAKHTDNKADIEAKLSDINNWYLPKE